MKRKSGRRQPISERVIFTLPKPLVQELKECARVMRAGNRSGFVADAVRSYIDDLRRRQNTARLRQSYADAAREGLAIARLWEPVDLEGWEQPKRKRPRSKKSR